jgi:hypothetical protein
VRDIEPLGFDLAVMDGYLSKHTIRFVRKILASPERREQMVDTNYAIAARHYSYRRLRDRLNLMLAGLFGETIDPLAGGSREPEMDGFLTIDPMQVVFKRFSTRNCSGRLGRHPVE